MAVDAWWRDENGEAVEQFQARQQQRSVPARTGLGALVEQTPGSSSRNRSRANRGRAQ
jgi:hypothetical protein